MDINLDDIKVNLDNIDDDNIDDNFIQWVTDVTLIWAAQKLLDGIAPVNGSGISGSDIDSICVSFD